jgi:hypothetical protein
VIAQRERNNTTSFFSLLWESIEALLVFAAQTGNMCVVNTVVANVADASLFDKIRNWMKMKPATSVPETSFAYMPSVTISAVAPRHMRGS